VRIPHAFHDKVAFAASVPRLAFPIPSTMAVAMMMVMTVRLSAAFVSVGRFSVPPLSRAK
jgi:hypothetical protein